MEIWIIVGLVVLAILFLMSMLARLYRKAGPHEALIVYGFRGTRVVKGHGTIIFPMIENCRDLSLELMSFDVAPQQDLYTKQGVAVTVEAVAQIKVKSDHRIDPDRGRAVPHQDRPGARRPDPAGDGRPPARHHRPAHGRRNRQAAGDGRRPHALHLRRRHEQDGPRSHLVHHQGSPRQERVHQPTWAGPTSRASSATPTSPPPKPSAIPPSSARVATRESAVAKAQADQERVLAETLSLAKQAEAQRDLEIKKAQYLEVTKKQQAQADKAYDIQTNIMQQQVIAEQVQGAAGRKRAAGQGAGSRNHAPRERTDRDRAEAGRDRASAHRNSGRRPKSSA